jgi:RNA polymerase sigma-70 factor, ECF subfamily
MKGSAAAGDYLPDMVGPRTTRAVATPEGVDQASPTFDELYAAHAGDVERWCRRLCGPHEEVDDFVHDVFIVVHRRLPEWRGEAQITTWLFAVCELVSRKRRRKQRLSRLTSSFERILLGRLASEDPSPFEQIERRESRSRLYEILDSLSDRYRTPLILFEIEGMSGDEVAQLMGIPLPTVWVRLHRGRAKLVALMATALKGDGGSKKTR